MRLCDALKLRFDVKTVSEACALLMDRVVGTARGTSDRHLHQLAAQLGVRVSVDRSADFEGKYTWGSDGETISLAGKGAASRQRFTFAHEIGHCIMRRFRADDTEFGERFRGVIEDAHERRQEEVLANALAAEILMPFRTVHEYLQFHSIGWKAVDELRKRLNVSQAAAIRRVAEISNRAFVYASLIPRRLAFFTDPVVVDDFLFIDPARGVQTGRDGIYLRRRPDLVRFIDIVSSTPVRIGFVTEVSILDGQFDVRRMNKPIASARLIGPVVAYLLPDKKPATSASA